MKEIEISKWERRSCGNWSKKVKKRFHSECQKCKTDQKIESHHIFNWADYLELRFVENNGVCLCLKCHDEFHSKFGLTKNNLKQIQDFLDSNCFASLENFFIEKFSLSANGESILNYEI